MLYLGSAHGGVGVHASGGTGHGGGAFVELGVGVGDAVHQVKLLVCVGESWDERVGFVGMHE